MNKRSLLFVALGLVGCGMGEPPPAEPSQFVAGFSPKAVTEGYTRMVAPPVVGIKPGTDDEYCQWVAAPALEDRDVISVIGQQSLGGHHAVLYASTNTKFPVGETHICTEDDMVSFSFLGAIGGEGNATDLTALPEGLYFRLRKGMALVINSHYVNSTPRAIDGQAIIDVKFGDASPGHMVADLFANNGAGFAIKPGESATYDVNCVLQRDMNFAMVTNHMHGYGTYAMSELIHKDGTKELLTVDETWPSERKFNPKYAVFGIKGAKVGKKGDTYHTQCKWHNSTTGLLAFPSEMCAGVGFYFPGDASLACVDGLWSTR